MFRFLQVELFRDLRSIQERRNLGNLNLEVMEAYTAYQLPGLKIRLVSRCGTKVLTFNNIGLFKPGVEFVMIAGYGVRHLVSCDPSDLNNNIYLIGRVLLCWESKRIVSYENICEFFMSSL